MSTTLAAPLPADAQRIIDDLDQADRNADSLVANLTDGQFLWQPDGGSRWSVALCLQHLAVTNELYGGCIRDAIDAARRQGLVRAAAFAPGFFGRKFIQSLEPPVKRRGRAPSKILPGSALTRTEILTRYHEAHERLRRMARDAAAIDANRATFVNPFIKLVRVKVGTGLQIITAHNRRHLWQAEQVVKRPDFPRR